MTRIVTVRFAPEREYEFVVPDEAVGDLTHDAARSWLAGQIEALECDPPNKMGKVLVTDIALALAQCAGEALFAEGGEWANNFAQALATLFDRPVVVVDLDQYRIG